MIQLIQFPFCQPFAQLEEFSNMNMLRDNGEGKTIVPGGKRATFLLQMVTTRPFIPPEAYNVPSVKLGQSYLLWRLHSLTRKRK